MARAIVRCAALALAAGLAAPAHAQADPDKPIDEEAGAGSKAVIASFPLLSIFFR